MTVTQKS